MALQAKYTMGLSGRIFGFGSTGSSLVCEDALAMAQKAKSRSLITNAQLVLAEVMLLNKNASATLQTVFGC